MLKIWNVSGFLILVLGLWVPNVFAAEGQEDAKAALERRATQYWEARQSRDIKTVYEMESASLPGGWLKIENAMAVTGLPIKNVKVEEVTVEGERGKTRVSADVMVGTIGWTRQTIMDMWVFINGQWYHETKRP